MKIIPVENKILWILSYYQLNDVYAAEDAWRDVVMYRANIEIQKHVSSVSEHDKALFIIVWWFVCRKSISCVSLPLSVLLKCIEFHHDGSAMSMMILNFGENFIFNFSEKLHNISITLIVKAKSGEQKTLIFNFSSVS
jgi:hypothetical protein